MSKKIISAALLATAAFATGAYAQSQTYGQGGTSQSTPQQQYDAQAPQYYNYQGDQATSPTYYQGDRSGQGYNGQYVDHKGYEMNNRPNDYARDLKDGPMGTSPGA